MWVKHDIVCNYNKALCSQYTATDIVFQQLTQLAQSKHLQQGGETVVMGSLF